MQRIVLALYLAGAAGLLAPKCTVRAPRAVLRAEAAEAPAETSAPVVPRLSLRLDDGGDAPMAVGCLGTESSQQLSPRSSPRAYPDLDRVKIGGGGCR